MHWIPGWHPTGRECCDGCSLQRSPGRAGWGWGGGAALQPFSVWLEHTELHLGMDRARGESLQSRVRIRVISWTGHGRCLLQTTCWGRNSETTDSRKNPLSTVSGLHGRLQPPQCLLRAWQSMAQAIHEASGSHWPYTPNMGNWGADTERCSAGHGRTGQECEGQSSLG